MNRIYFYIISLALVLPAVTQTAYSQDTVDVPLKIRASLEVSGPAIYFSDKKILNTEGFFSIDLNERRSVQLGGGYSDFTYSQYNYSYHSNGFFFRSGIDFNLLSPVKAQGKYWAGIGFHYGLSRYTSETPFFSKDNYWGNISSSLGSKSGWAHYIEASPGVRAEIIKNISIGWNISLRALIYSGSTKDLRPLYLPGYGSGGKRFSTGVSYYISWNIPYKRITVITRPPAPEEPEEPPVPGSVNGLNPKTTGY
jgi:hypothetical protein